MGSLGDALGVKRKLLTAKVAKDAPGSRKEVLSDRCGDVALLG